MLEYNIQHLKMLGGVRGPHESVLNNISLGKLK